MRLDYMAEGVHSPACDATVSQEKLASDRRTYLPLSTLFLPPLLVVAAIYGSGYRVLAAGLGQKSLIV